MKRTKIITTDTSQFPHYSIFAWNINGSHAWDQIDLVRGRDRALQVAAQWEAAHPPAQEGKRIIVYAAYPNRVYGTMEHSNYEGDREIANFPNSPRGWDHARELRQGIIDDYRRSHGGDAQPPRVRIVVNPVA